MSESGYGTASVGPAAWFDRMRRPAASRSFAIALGAGLIVGACGGTLGGRQKCWPDARSAGVFSGRLQITGDMATLLTSDGSVGLRDGGLRIAPDGSGTLLDGEKVIARSGDMVTIFGGVGADDELLMCSLESSP